MARRMVHRKGICVIVLNGMGCSRLKSVPFVLNAAGSGFISLRVAKIIYREFAGS